MPPPTAGPGLGGEGRGSHHCVLGREDGEGAGGGGAEGGGEGNASRSEEAEM